MRVTAAEGLRVPLENKPRQYVDAEPVDVPDTSYYRRRLAAGELIQAPAVSDSTTETEQAADTATTDVSAKATAKPKKGATT